MKARYGSTNLRLPGYDARTGRSEAVAFLGLAFVGMALITSAFFSGGQYAQNREAIVASLEQGHSLAAAAGTNFAVTNFMPAHKTVFGGAPAAGASRPRT